MLGMEDGDTGGGEETGFQEDGNGDMTFSRAVLLSLWLPSSRMSGDIIESNGSSHSLRAPSTQGSAESFVSPDL